MPGPPATTGAAPTSTPSACRSTAVSRSNSSCPAARTAAAAGAHCARGTSATRRPEASEVRAEGTAAASASGVTAGPGSPRAPEVGGGERTGRDGDLRRQPRAGGRRPVEPLLQLQQPGEHGLGTRRAARHVHVDRHELVDALHDRVGVPVGAAAVRAGAHRQHVPRLGHRVVQRAHGGRELVGDRPGDHQHVGRARSVRERQGGQPARGAVRDRRRHELDRAAREAQVEDPQPVAPAGVEHQLHGGRQPVRSTTNAASSSRAARAGPAGSRSAVARASASTSASRPGLGHRRVRAQQGERLGVAGVVLEGAGHQLAQPGPLRVGPARTSSTGSVRTPSRRSVPGVLPD